MEEQREKTNFPKFDVSILRAELAKQNIQNNYLALQWQVSPSAVTQKLQGQVRLTIDELLIVGMILKKPMDYFYR